MGDSETFKQQAAQAAFDLLRRNLISPFRVILSEREGPHESIRD